MIRNYLAIGLNRALGVKKRFVKSGGISDKILTTCQKAND